MKKCNCENCVCLVEGNNGEWICDEVNKPIEEVKHCPEGIKEELKMIVCPNCGFNPQDEPYCIETHCPKCGYMFGKAPTRIKELYDNMLDHISELVSGTDLVDTLRAIGFTDEEIVAEGFEIEEEN